ncbi:MAG: flagellar biosynthesis protein FlhF [Pseudomonadales bacterium]
MQVKRFVAPTMRLALKMVREEIGPEAVILSNKRVPDGVEILTAIEQAEPQMPIPSTMPDNPFQHSDLSSQSSRHELNKPGPSKLEQELEQMQIEARQRAEALAAALAKQSNKQKESLLEVSADDEGRASMLVADTSVVNTPLANDAAVGDKIIGDTLVDDKVADDVVEVKTATATAHVDKMGNDSELSQMRFELQSMRDLLEQQLSTLAWGQFSQQNPQKASLWRRLKRMGVTAPVADSLLNKVGELVVDEGKKNPAVDIQGTAFQIKNRQSTTAQSTWQLLMQNLSNQLPVDDGDLTGNGGVFAFVGPTGAGKTTTIGKLAARYVLKHGAENVALITTDTVRIAAHEQLRTFGRILNVPVNVVDNNNSLERVLYSLRHKSLVLIDTAGLNRQDPRLKQQLITLNELGNRVKTILVIPTTSQVEVIKAVYHTYKTDNLKSCVLTKLDETASLGGAISLLVEKALPVAYSTDGQGIPDDIAIADNDQLIRSAIELARCHVTDDDAMVDEMVSLSRNWS